MATRVEKIFRAGTIQLTNSILNEINDFVEYKNSNSKKTKKHDDSADALMYSHIAHSINNFYEEYNITDEEVQRAVAKKGR